MHLTLLSTTIINDALPTELGADVGDLPTLFQGTQTDADRLIEWAGRVCYLSTARQGHAPNFLRKRMEEGHTDIFEHVTATFRVRGGLPLLLPYVNRFAVVTPPPGLGLWGLLGGFFLGRSTGDWLVSGNLRVWMNLINQGHLLEALPTLKALAPQTFETFPRPEGTRTGESSIPLLYKRVQVPPFTDGPRRVVCLGASIPEGLPLDELLAHGTVTFLVEGVSRTATHQLVRHRLGSFSMASQRYISLEKGGWHPVIPPKIGADPETLAITQDFFAAAETAYAQLRARGILAEDARFLLPGAADSRLVVTMPLWGWANFLEQREAKDAQWEIRSMAYGVRAGLHTLLPLIF